MSAKSGHDGRGADGRFVPGRSGNAKGRPRKARSAADTTSDFDVLFDRKLTVTEGGVAREFTVDEALQLKTLQAALKGSRLAQREVARMLARREAALAEKRPKPEPKRVQVWETTDPDNADAALLLLGIARTDPVPVPRQEGQLQLLLEPWAVQMALGRRRGGTALTEQQVEDIRRVTHAPDTLRWPRGRG